MRQWVLILLVIVFLWSCSSTPEFDTAGTNPQFTPQVVAESSPLPGPQRVFWGGTVVKTTNLQSATHIEVLAYPLKSSGRPNRNKDPFGRFIIEQNGFLDPAKYSQGREVTIVGNVLTVAAGKVGEAPYRFPVVQPEQLHLWPRRDQRQGTNVHFGVGVGVSR